MAGHFDFKRLIKFVIPSILMMIVTSIYSIVDGLFVSNFAGKNAFAAVNLVMPFLMILGSLGFMIGTGGSALVSYTLGLGERDKARQTFSMLVTVLLVFGICIAVAGYFLMPRIVIMLGATSLIKDTSILYGRILMISITGFMLQNAYQSFLITAGKAKLGLFVSIASGVMNMLLDYLLVYVFKLGVVGAAAATATCELIGAIVPTIYFFTKNKSDLSFVKFTLNWKDLFKACTNGISEMLTNLSLSVLSMVYNFELLKLAKENGVAAYGVIMYVGFIFLAVYFGFSMGLNSLVGYKYGEGDSAELKSLLRKSLTIISVTGILMFAMSEGLSYGIAKMFVGYDKELFDLTQKGFRIYSISFLFSGFNIFASSFFTGLNNGKISAIISFSRTFVIQIICVIVLPLIWGITGIWFAVVVAEILTIILSFYLINKYKITYGYA